MISLQVSQMLPETFAEQHVRIYCKKRDDQSILCVRRAFRKWCALQHCTTPKVKDFFLMQVYQQRNHCPQGNADDPELTPTCTPITTPIKVGALPRATHVL